MEYPIHQHEFDVDTYADEDCHPRISKDEIMQLEEDELRRRFYEVAESAGHLTVASVEAKIAEEEERAFWDIAKHLPDPPVQAIESEIDDLKIARRMRMKRHEDAEARTTS